jgi:conjugative relaxase-like TrwC/TraI family protein
VLTVTTLGAGRGGYYLSHLESEAAWDLAGPRWLGEGARALGLAGAASGSAFLGVLGGRAPSGARLAHRRTRVAGYDLTFSAPKSVSVLFGLGEGRVGPDVVAAHEAAVEAAVAYVGTRAAALRLGSGELGPSDGVIACAFSHGTSRALDPHLHSHVVVANMAHSREGRWRAVDGRGLFAHRRAAGAVYDAQLRVELTARQGVAWRRQGRGLEVEGVDPALVGALSSRAAEIRAQVHEHGVRSGRGRRVAWVATRDAKEAAIDPDTVRDRWRGTAASFGREVPEGTGWDRGDPTLDEHALAAALLGEGDGAVTRRRVVEGWADAARSGVAREALEAGVDLWWPVEPAVGVAESRHPARRALARPAELAVLGPRPLAPDAQRRWLAAGRALVAGRDGVDHHRSRSASGRLASLPPRELAAYLAAREERRRTELDTRLRLHQARERT